MLGKVDMLTFCMQFSNLGRIVYSCICFYVQGHSVSSFFSEELCGFGMLPSATPTPNPTNKL